MLHRNLPINVNLISIRFEIHDEGRHHKYFRFSRVFASILDGVFENKGKYVTIRM